MNQEPIQLDLFGGPIGGFFIQAIAEEQNLTPGQRTKIKNAGKNLEYSSFEGIELHTIQQVVEIICRPHLIWIPGRRRISRPGTPEKNMYLLLQFLGSGVGMQTTNLMVFLLRKHGKLQQREV